MKTLAILTLGAVIIASGCSSNAVNSDTDTKRIALLPADEIKQGPGIFSGDKGAFYVIGGAKKVQQTQLKKNSSVTHYQKPVNKMDLNETSQVLDEKIKQLQRDQMELELLKRQVDKKLQN